MTDDTPELAALTTEELALLRESTDPQYQRLPMPERELVARLLAVHTALDPAGLRAALHQGVETALTLSSDPFSRRERVHAAIDTALVASQPAAEHGKETK